MKPTMIVAQFKQRTMLLSDSVNNTDSNASLHYRGSDAEYQEGVR